MKCMICDSPNVIRLIGQVAGQTFLICPECAEIASRTEPGDTFEYGRRTVVGGVTVMDEVELSPDTWLWTCPLCQHLNTEEEPHENVGCMRCQSEFKAYTEI